MAAAASQAGATSAEDMEDDGGLAWYAAAAAGESDEEEEEEGDEEAPEASQDPYLASDPYLAADPYSEAAIDPYEDIASEKAVEPVAAAASPSPAAAAVPPAPTAVAASTAAAAPAVASATATAAERLAAAFLAELPEPAAPPTTPSTSSASVPADARPSTSTSTAASVGTATSTGRSRGAVVDMSEESAGARRRGPEAPPSEQPPAKAQKTQAQVQTLPPAQPPASPQAPPLAQQPSPGSQDGGQEKPAAEKLAQVQPEPTKPGAGPEAAAVAPVPEAVEPPLPKAEGAPSEEPTVLDLPDGGEGDEAWDARVLVVRQGQVHIEIQHRKPPMRDPMLLRFCDWLDQQLPVVVGNFPYVRKSGAYVDLSDNIIGPEGLDKLFRVLRDHRVPCVVMKAYRNVLDDSIVDTLIEYLYTQPESFPMHGIHISHNNITDKGALRLIRAASLCGHYPRLSSRLPLWLRLEANDIQSPHKLISDCQKECFNVCLMGNGLCSRPDCNHYSGVHVQLPYFFHQGRKGQDQYDKERSVAKAQAPVPALPPPEAPTPAAVPEAPAPEVAALPGDEAFVGEEVPVIDLEEALPDWKRNQKVDTRAVFMVPAPKTANFRPAPKCPAGRRRGAAELPGESPMELSAEDALASEALELLPGSGDMPMLDEPPLMPMGIQRVVRPSAPGGLGQPAPPPGPPPMEAYMAAMSSPLNAMGITAKIGMPPSRPPLPGWKGGAPQKGRGRGGRGGVGWKEGGGHGSPGGGKGWGGNNKMWQGPSLQSKAKKDVRLAEGENDLGLQWRFFGEGHAPKVMAVVPGSKVSEVARPGDSLLRVNGLDTSMFSERQIADMLKQRPLSLRFGDE